MKAESVKRWSETFVYANKVPLLIATLITPIAVEALYFGSKCVEFRDEIKEKFVHFCHSISSKKAAKIAAVILIVTAVAATAYVTLPILFASSVALLALSLAIKTYNDPLWLKKGFDNLKVRVQKAFIIQPNQPLHREILRIAKNVLITTAALIAIGIIAMVAQHLIAGTLLVHSAGWVSLNPAISSIINFPALAIGTYLTMAFLNLYWSYEAFSNGEKLKGTYYLLTGLMGLIFPITILAGMQELRLHHSAIGLAFASLPFRSFSFFGWMLMLDSLLYLISPHNKYEFDYANIMVNHAGAIFGVLLIAAAMQLLTSTLFPKKKKDPLSTP